MRAPWYCISSPTIWPAGASARDDSIDAAINAPMVSSRAPIRYTPITMMATLDSWVRKLVPYIADDDSARIFTFVSARNALARSQRAWITPSAPCDLMVSMPVRLSIRVALRSAPA